MTTNEEALVDKALVALIEEARRETACHCSGVGVVNRETCSQHGGAEANLIGRLADALEASAVSAPPTITDEAAVDRATRAMYKMTASLSMSGARDLARAALRAALNSPVGEGGEA